MVVVAASAGAAMPSNRMTASSRDRVRFKWFMVNNSLCFIYLPGKRRGARSPQSQADKERPVC